MKDYLNEYISYLKLVKGSSNNTIESYKRDIVKYLDFLRVKNINDTTTVSSETIAEYISSLEINGKSAATITRTISSIKTYYKFLIHINRVRELPNFSRSQIDKERSLPIVLEVSEVKALLDQPDINEIKGIRDKAMLETLYATGIKVSELISLRVDDINIQSEFIKSGNGRSERIVPLHKGAIKILLLYINQIRPALVNDENDVLFVNMNGSPITRQGFWKILKGYASAAGINKAITPHTIRHSFAYHLLENGADLNDIKELLGHADISSTQIYSQLIKSKYAKSYTKFHPLANN